MFCDLYDKYGKDFNWYLLPLTQADGAFVVELNKEIGQGHFLSGKKIRAVAKCDSNDDVLYVVRSGIGRDIYYMFDLTYSAHNADGFPRYAEFADLFAGASLAGTVLGRYEECLPRLRWLVWSRVSLPPVSYTHLLLAH